MTRSAGFAAIAAMMMTGTLGAAKADGLPGLRGHDHTGITVPDMDKAVHFFTDVLGCKAAMSFGPFSGMGDVLNIDADAKIDKITMVRCGAGSNIELFQYTSPDQKNMTPKNSDIGGMHIALYVDDVQKAKDYLDSQGVKTFKGPIAIGAGPRRAKRSCISSHPGACSSRRSATPRDLATRKRPIQSFGSRPIRRSRAAWSDLERRSTAA